MYIKYVYTYKICTCIYTYKICIYTCNLYMYIIYVTYI